MPHFWFLSYAVPASYNPIPVADTHAMVPCHWWGQATCTCSRHLGPYRATGGAEVGTFPQNGTAFTTSSNLAHSTSITSTTSTGFPQISSNLASTASTACTARPASTRGRTSDESPVFLNQGHSDIDRHDDMAAALAPRHVMAHTPLASYGGRVMRLSSHVLISWPLQQPRPP